jgi:hypothetical protein
MSALAVAEDPTLFDQLGDEPTLFRQLGGEPTLDDLIVGAWEGLTAHEVVHCPICGGELAPEYGVHSRPVAGHCRDCGSRLS